MIDLSYDCTCLRWGKLNWWLLTLDKHLWKRGGNWLVNVSSRCFVSSLLMYKTLLFRLQFASFVWIRCVRTKTFLSKCHAKLERWLVILREISSFQLGSLSLLEWSNGDPTWMMLMTIELGEMTTLSTRLDFSKVSYSASSLSFGRMTPVTMMKDMLSYFRLSTRRWIFCTFPFIMFMAFCLPHKDRA